VPDCSAQALIDAPLDRVWELATDPNRQTEWWPDQLVFEVEDGTELTLGCRVRSVEHRPWPVDDFETTLEVEQCQPGHELTVRCLNTGGRTNVLLTEAQGGTFIQVTVGVDPANLPGADRVLFSLAGKRVFRRWVEHAVKQLRIAAETETVPA
jgi:uncharacterized protein YndB with AHSA1/START domain